MGIVHTKKSRQRQYLKDKAFKEKAKRKSSKPRVIYDAEAGSGKFPPISNPERCPDPN
jgi:hypothetical protein